jgi:hypothetical protein
LRSTVGAVERRASSTPFILPTRRKTWSTAPPVTSPRPSSAGLAGLSTSTPRGQRADHRERAARPSPGHRPHSSRTPPGQRPNPAPGRTVPSSAGPVLPGPAGTRRRSALARRRPQLAWCRRVRGVVVPPHPLPSGERLLLTFPPGQLASDQQPRRARRSRDHRGAGEARDRAADVPDPGTRGLCPRPPSGNHHRNALQ